LLHQTSPIFSHSHKFRPS